MTLQISTYRIGEPRKSGKTLRIGTVRFLPRGVPKKEYAKRGLFDIWLPLVAPSREVIKAYQSGKKSWAQFSRAYRSEMKEPAARHVIELLAKVAERMPLEIGCYCEDESQCHRSVLIELIRSA
jgi:uncharacterized protein YeaO (DUF488 family)